MGGVGSWCAGGGEEAVVVAVGVAIRACRERHVLTILPKAFCAVTVGGLAGGEANSAAWRRVVAVCDESHWSAEGNSMFAERSRV